MVGMTLGDIRQYIESLSSDSGQYVLVCSRTGERPVPAGGLAFETRPTARAAARATEQYRAALRRYDPRVPYYDVVVCQRVIDDDSIDDRSPEAVHSADAESVIDFCHTVAGAVFETIADSPHDELEDAIMATYFDAAERIEHTDELCLRLLESMARELETRLDPDEQTDLLLSATQRLPPHSPSDDPLESSLSQLQSAAMLRAYTLHSRPVDPDTGTRTWDVTVTDYALARPGERIVTLPIALELLRQYPTRELGIAAAERVPSEDTPVCRLTVTTDPTGQPTGLVSVAAEGQR